MTWDFASPPDSECDFTYKVERKTTGSYTTIVASQEEQRHSDSGLSARTRYTYRITARSDDGARSGIAWATTPCPAPSGLVLSARATSRSRIYLSWRNNSLPSGCGPSYKIERKRGLGGYVTIVESQTDNTHSDTGLSSGTTYWYRVTASNDGGSDSDTEAETTHRPTPSPNPPPPPEPEVSRPTGLTARAVSPSEVEVSWSAVSGADRYDTQMMDSGGSWSAAVDAGTGTSHSYTGLAAETEYDFRVRTVDGSRTSDWTASVSATTPPLPLPEVNPPTGLGATAVSWSEIEVVWQSVAGADRFDLQRSRNGGPWGATVDAGAGTAFDDTGLAGNSRYSYRLRTVAGSRESEWTAAVSATTEVQPPANPAATAESPSSVRVTWEAIAGADRYDLRRSEDGGSWGSPVNVGTGTEFLMSGLTAETRYGFQLRTVAGSRTSDWTASVSATTGSVPTPDPPTDFRSTGATATTVALRWDAVSGAARYRIRRAARGESGWERFKVETTSAVDEDLDPATTYRYQIQAVPAEGRPSAWSAPALSVTTAALGTPANLRVTGQTTTTVSLAWDAVAEAEGYELRRDGSTVIAAGGVTSYTDESLTTDTAYAYEARAFRGSARSAWSPAVPARTGAGVMPPENLEAEATSAFSVEVSWDAASDADGYEVYRVHDASSVRVTGTSHEETGLAPETTGTWQVRATAGSMQSDWTLAVSATTPAFRAPENFAASVSRTTVGLRWDAVPGTETYRLRRRQGSGSWEKFEETETSASDEELAEGTEFEYQVRGLRGPYKSPWSAAVRVTTGFLPLTGPEGFGVEESGGAHLALSWDAASGADGYDLERLGGANLTWMRVAAALAATTYQDEGLRPDTSYRYRLRAVRGAETSEWSDELAARTSAAVAAPGGLSAEAVSATEVSLRWEAVPGGDMSYRIRRRVRGTRDWSDAFSGSGTSGRDTGLEPLTEYAYQGRTIYRLSGQGYRSGWTDLVYATTEAPAAPVLRLDSVTGAAVELEWSTVAGAVEYEVRRRSPADAGSWTSVDTLPATALTDSDVVAGREYEYQVRAFVLDAQGRTLTTGWSDSLVAEPEG